MERVWPHSPAPLAVVGAGIAVSWFAGLNAAGVATVGLIPQALPSITLPAPDLVMQLLPGAIGIALMSFTETIAAGRAFAAPSEPPIRANRELLATGAANLAGAFFGAMPAGGGTSQTAVVRAVGGRTQKASLVTAAASAATMLALAPLLGLLPQAVLAAIVIVYSVGLIQPLEFASIRKVRRMEFRWALAAFLGVLAFGTLQGIVVAIVLSLLGLSSQAAHPRIHVIGRKRGEDLLRPVSPEHPDDETFEGLLILRPEGRLFFANAQQVGDRIRELVAENKPRVLMLDLSRVFDIEYSALQMMIEGERRFADEGVTVWLAGLNPDVLDYIRRSGLADRLGKERMFPNARAGPPPIPRSFRAEADDGCTGDFQINGRLGRTGSGKERIRAEAVTDVRVERMIRTYPASAAPTRRFAPRSLMRPKLSRNCPIDQAGMPLDDPGPRNFGFVRSSSRNPTHWPAR